MDAGKSGVQRKGLEKEREENTRNARKWKRLSSVSQVDRE